MLYTLLQISDSSFPSGGFAHSYGLEGLLSTNRATTEEGWQQIVESVFTQHLLHCDGLLGLAAHRAVRRAALTDLCREDRALSAMKAPRELREASVDTGRGFLAEAARLSTSETLHGWCEQVASGASPGNYSIAFHAVGAAVALSEHDTALAWGYQTMAQMGGALVRLGLFGHRGAQSLLSAMRPAVENGVKEILARSPESPSSFAPLLEIASMRHERQYSRLFRS